MVAKDGSDLERSGSESGEEREKTTGAIESVDGGGGGGSVNGSLA